MHYQKKYLVLITCILIVSTLKIYSQNLEVIVNKIGTASTPSSAEVQLKLIERFQHFNPNPSNQHDNYDNTVYSPKSAIILNRENKLYINNLEGYSTSVYDLGSMQRKSVIKHHFTAANNKLFLDTTLFDYRFRTKKSNQNIFKGKPVESTFSHNGKYLWVTYYRRDFDLNAIDPSAVAIIDTETNMIKRVMPTAPLPKMIACSPDNKFIAVTHWGDNTVGIIDISSNNVEDFKYLKLFEVDKRLKLNYNTNTKIDRDNDCGFCLRGTVFSPDSKYLLIGRMGGGGIAIFDMLKMDYLGSVFGMKSNIRHLLINSNELIIGTNISGYVQKTSLQEFIEYRKNSDIKHLIFNNWKSRYVGKGVRTVSCTSDGKYIFAAVNNENKISVIRSSDMKIISSIKADSFPVGMTLSEDNSILVATSQGKSKYGGGHSIMIYKVTY